VELLLLSPEGREVLARAEILCRDGKRSELAVAVALRTEFPPELAAAAMAQRELRAAARAKFTRADEMLFTRGGYEQSSSEVIARHRAARFAGLRRVADLCCGIGGDLIALAADPGREVLAVDRDETHARLALHNAAVYGASVAGGAVGGGAGAGGAVAGTGGGVRACVADVRDVPLVGFDAVFIDPARRSDTRGAGAGTSAGAGAGPGRFRAGVSEPPLSWCFALADQVPAVCVKAAPGLPSELVPAGWEAEFIADGRDLKEAVLWSRAFTPGAQAAPRRATILPEGHSLVAVPGDPVRVGPPGEYLLDPSPAVTRAGLVEDLARTVGGWKIDDQIAFIAINKEVVTPFARTLRVVDSAPWNEKRFAVRLRELGVGAADLRRRGLAGDVDQIRRRLKLAGPHRATIVLTRVDDKPWGLICADPGTPLARGLPPQQDAAGVDRLAGVLHVVVDDADEAHAERHRRRPRAVDDTRQLLVGEIRDVLERLLVRRVVVLQEPPRRRRYRVRDGGHVGGSVAVPGVEGVFRQAEPCRPRPRLPHLPDAERARDVVVLDARQVPDQPAYRVGARLDLVRELCRGHGVERILDGLADAAECVGQQFRTGHGSLPGSLPT
jgi:hypothetical protein